MIYADPSETRKGTVLPDIPGMKTIPFLEELTGADFLITISQMPASSRYLVLEHIKQGALLVQRKSGNDLLQSIGGRMAHSLGKMVATRAKQSQCILLYIGCMSSFGVESGDYWKVVNSVSKWNNRGGTSESILSHEMLEKWFIFKEKHLLEYKANPVKYVYPDKPEITALDSALQIPYAVNDARITLATIPFIGPKRANELWKQFDGRLSTILCWLSNPNAKAFFPNGEVRGISKGIVKASRKWLGLDEIDIMAIETLPELIKEAQERFDGAVVSEIRNE